MKMRDMVQRSGLSKDTLRYYMSLGLLMPRKGGAQFEFTDADEEDIQEILHLKRMGFSLEDIRGLLDERRISNGIEPDYLDSMINRLHAQKKSLEARQKEISEAIALVDDEIESCERKKGVFGESSGVPLCALPLLACPHCGHGLQIENAAFSGKHLHSGNLLCACGYSAGIVDGVILTGNRYLDTDDRPDLTRGLYHGLCRQDFFRCYCDGATACMDALREHGFEQRVVLESNINGYFLLYQQLKLLPISNLYIIADKYPEMVYLYKHLIESINPALDILYIADEKMEYPLQHGCVDIAIDFFGENEYLFYHNESYIEKISPYLAPDAFGTGIFMAFAPGYPSRAAYKKKYPKLSPIQHDFPAIERAYRAAGFELDARELGIITKTNNEYNFTCHRDGDPMKLWFFCGERKGE